MTATEPRSYCPINLSLEIFGDSWTLLVLRDMMFAGKRHFRELLQSDERISSNILADRLARLGGAALVRLSLDLQQFSAYMRRRTAHSSIAHTARKGG